MNDSERKKSFLEIAKGAMLERFDYELEKIIENIMDINTPASKPRQINLVLTMKPDAERKTIGYEVVVKSKTQPTNPISGAVATMADHNGVLTLVEMVPQVPGQMMMDNQEQAPPDIIQFRKQA